MEKKVIYIIIMMILTMLSSNVIEAQSFIVSDINFSERVSEYRREKTLKDALGSQIDISFFDNAIRIEAKGYKGETEVVVLSKINDDKYSFKKDGDELVLTFEKIFAYIRKIKLTFYKNGEWDGSITAKRKDIL